MSILTSIQAMMPEPNAVTAPVPGAGPSTSMPASVAPRTSKRGGILGAISSVFAPEPDSFWAGALRDGLWSAKESQSNYKAGLAKAALDAQRTTAQIGLDTARTQNELDKPDYSIAGNNVVIKGPDGQPQFVQPPPMSTETERMIAALPPELQQEARMRAIKGYQYSAPYIAADTGRKAAVKRTVPGKAAGAAKAAGARGSSLPPLGKLKLIN